MNLAHFKPAQNTPSQLRAEARVLWQSIVAEYQISDSGGLLILATALESFDRMRHAQVIIAEHGVVLVGDDGKLKANPACALERDSRAAMLAALKMMNLDLEPLKKLGRPGGS
ncbi:MAG: P27 family phage terminase small subunit [Pseudomonadota bacterium]|nr:hypothetical protein [Burkholderiales bacterium]MDQ3196389.1 P27 family phage terminase small subunit [Pseudomonadota bacterium]